MTALDRRSFLCASLGSLALPALTLRPAPEDSRPALLLIQLTGGNDGLNTLVPWSDPDYYRARPLTAIPEAEVLRLDDAHGLHPGLENLRRRYEDGQVAIVRAAGYERPVRSHFKSLDIWHTADRAGRAAGDGWITRLGRELFPDEAPVDLVVNIGTSTPYSVRSADRPPISFEEPRTFDRIGGAATKRAVRRASRDLEEERAGTLRARSLARLRRVTRDADRVSQAVRDAIHDYEPAVRYAADDFALALANVAALVEAGTGTRVFSVALSGFDTHVALRRRHDRLMARFDRALGAFLRDLERQELADRVVTMVYSEFGRRLDENASEGTDHGTAGPMFVIGGDVRGGLHGDAPSLRELDSAGDIAHTTDFRSVYAEVLRRCFECDPRRVLAAVPDGPVLFTPR